MAISVTNIGIYNANSLATTATITIPVGGVPSGSLIVLAASELAAYVAGGSAADTNNTPYSSIAHVSYATTFFQQFYFQNAAALVSGNTITYTKQSPIQTLLSAFYATGIATSGVLDTAVTASGTTTVTSGTPSIAGELFVALAGVHAITSTGGTYVQDTGNGWSAPYSTSNASYGPTSKNLIGGGNQVNSGTGTKTFAPTGLVAFQGMQVIGFKPLSLIKQRRTTTPLGTRVGSRQMAA